MKIFNGIDAIYTEIKVKETDRRIDIYSGKQLIITLRKSEKKLR